ncbi:MAG: GAF domain-containing sensor histidine kinase [Chloroflexi bacterium]|nr:GAF domain-containing sensor histidine kinase [Chloroflexota bacterium]
MSPDPLPPRLTRVIRPLRWVIPLILSALGFGYTIWESILWDGYPILSVQFLLGLGLLGLAGPLLTFVTLTWAERVAASYERAEEARERQYRQLLALNTIIAAVNQSLDLDTVLHRALDHVLSVMRIESGEVRLIENNRLTLRAYRGVSAEFVQQEQSIPLGQCVCGKSAARGELIAVEDLERAPHLSQTTCACERFRAVLSVPVRTTDHVVGVIHVASQTPRAFSPADRALLVAIGHQVGGAIEKAQLHAELKALNQQLEARVVQRTRDLLAAKEELARKADALRQVLAEERRVEERTRAQIAHDLHDGIQQIIIGALFETQAARETLAAQPETALQRLDDAQQLLRRIESEMRDAIYSLRPVALDAQGLAPALRECVVSFERVARIPCELQIEEPPRRFSPEAEVAAFRIVQEALNNVEAHAQAKRACVRVRFGPREVRVEIADDGCGFDMVRVTNEPRTQLGLMGMQERAESVGGKLDVWSRVGEGARVELTIPMV